ncbi:MAG: class I SAM-dependent methyltransferase [Anaerolineae bacterium]|nr:class I SAM-dependent methyltransferase [Anaerolineae bacterium]
MMPFDEFHRALLAFGANDIAQALASARAAARLEPGNRVFTQAVTYLERVQAEGKANVYVDGEAFAAFIRGGGNVGLYAAASARLRTIYQDYTTFSLLDIGVGDGLALLPALTMGITRLDLIEPSEAMLGRTTAALDGWNLRYSAHQTTIQAFMAREITDSWDVIQATWSLQNIPPDERPAVFVWLRAHGQRVLIAEFDVPDFPDMYAPERVRYVVDRYARGLAEYEGDQVAQGFLMPVMFGYFDQTAARTNWEYPVQTWIAGLNAAGFARVQAHKLYEYFWADAYLIDAS